MLLYGADVTWRRTAESRAAGTESSSTRITAQALALNMFCQYIYLWMYVIPSADL